MSTKSNVMMKFDEICQWLGVETMERFMDRCSYWDSNFPPEMTEEEVSEEIERLEGEAASSYISERNSRNHQWLRYVSILFLTGIH